MSVSLKQLRPDGLFFFCPFIFRYAFSPLLDAADEDDEANEPMMNDAFGKSISVLRIRFFFMYPVG